MKERGKRQRFTIFLLLGMMILFFRCGTGGGGDGSYDFSAIYPGYLYQIKVDSGSGTYKEIDTDESYDFDFTLDTFGYYPVSSEGEWYMLLNNDQVVIWEGEWTPLIGVKRLDGPTGLEVGGTYNWLCNEWFEPWNKLIVYPTDPPDGTGYMEMWAEDYDYLFDVLDYEFDNVYMGMASYPEGGDALHALKDTTAKADAIPPMMAFPLDGDIILMGTDYSEIEFFATREQPEGYSILDDSGQYTCLAGYGPPRTILTIEECPGYPGDPCARFDYPDGEWSPQIDGIYDEGDGSFWIDDFMYGIIAPGKLIVLQYYDNDDDIFACVPALIPLDLPEVPE